MCLRLELMCQRSAAESQISARHGGIERTTSAGLLQRGGGDERMKCGSSESTTKTGPVLEVWPQLSVCSWRVSQLEIEHLAVTSNPPPLPEYLQT